MNHCSRPCVVAIIAYLLTSWFASAAQGQNEPFYKGKTVRFVVGSAPANFYDSWARLIARYWGKHIPGNPNVIVQNMPGAGSITAVNYVYGVAKPDGLTVVLPNNSIYIEQLVGRREAQLDLQKFHWLGSAAQESIMFYMRADTPYKSIAGIIRAKQPPSCGGSGTTSSDYIVAKILELAVGAKINSVSGYQGGSDADLAVEKGEIVCRAHTLASHFGREPFNSWHKKTSIFTCCSPDASAIRARRRLRPCMRFSRNSKCRMVSGALLKRCSPAENSVDRS